MICFIKRTLRSPSFSGCGCTWVSVYFCYRKKCLKADVKKKKKIRKKQKKHKNTRDKNTRNKQDKSFFFYVIPLSQKCPRVAQVSVIQRKKSHFIWFFGCIWVLITQKWRYILTNRSIFGNFQSFSTIFVKWHEKVLYFTHWKCPLSKNGSKLTPFA